MVKTCPQCQTQFTAKPSKATHCSRVCAAKTRKLTSTLYTVTCRTCGLDFYSFTARSSLCEFCERNRTCRNCGKCIANKPLKNISCSKHCSAQWRYYNTVIGVRIGWTDPDWVAKKLKGMRGKPRATRISDDTALADRDKAYHLSEYREWRRQVFERDNYTCQICGKRGGDLNAHHKIRWADDESKRFEVSNGLTLCIPCHRAVHAV